MIVSLNSVAARAVDVKVIEEKEDSQCFSKCSFVELF